MKILDLFEDSEIGYDRPEVVPNFIKKFSSGAGNLEKLGVGSYAIVYNKPGAVDTVIKKNIVDEVPRMVDGQPDDPYLHYVLAIIRSRGNQANPYFPQIFRIDFRFLDSDEADGDDRSKPFAYEIEIEKLSSLSGLGHLKLDDFMERVSGDPSGIEAQFYNALERTCGSEFVEEYFGNVKNRMNSTVGGLMFGFWDKVFASGISANSNMEEAIRLIDGLGDETDLHLDNVMYRPTAYGMQLVFTDPVY